MSFESRIKLLATWFGLGRAPKAPGTFGTVGAIPVVFAFGFFGEMGYMAATVAFSALSIWVAQMYEDFIVEEHDCPEFVMDEVAGFLVAMTWVPFTFSTVLIGFALFRLFDAVKPWPISWCDRKIPGGVGTVADDLVAGIVTNVILQVILAKYGVPAWH
jgi:phosphatidylglycerophosphatase A